MLDTVREIILESQEAAFNTGVPRHLALHPVPNKATVCIGVRRCGKSTLMYQQAEKLLAAGVARDNICFINFFDDRLHGLQQAPLGVILDAYYSLYPQKKGEERVYWFFDEIQSVPNWEPFVERLIRTEDCQVFITGSSARMLSREIATQMRGRALSWELFPFSFREFLAYGGLHVGGAMSPRVRLRVQAAFDDYWDRGGFPEVAGLGSPLRIRIHQEYFHAILYRDLVERHDPAHPKAIIDLAHRLIDNTASLYTLNKLWGYLQSLGHKITKSAVAEYLDWFEDAYFLFTVRLFDASIAKSNANPKKIYAIDHSFVSSTSSGVLVNSGHLLENLVFVALRSRTRDIHYYKTKNGREIDFIIKLEGQRHLVQVSESITHARTRKRELDALAEAMGEQGLSRGTVVTRNEQEELRVAQGTIHVIPAWRFLLEFPQERHDGAR